MDPPNVSRESLWIVEGSQQRHGTEQKTSYTNKY